jgi:hypothetical protein
VSDFYEERPTWAKDTSRERWAFLIEYMRGYRDALYDVAPNTDTGEAIMRSRDAALRHYHQWAEL